MPADLTSLRYRAARRWFAPFLVIVLGIGAIVLAGQLQRRADEAKQAQLTLGRVETELNQLQNAPFHSSTSTGGSAARGRAEIDRGTSRIAAALGELRRSTPAPALTDVSAPLQRNYQLNEMVYAIGVRDNDYGREADQLGARAGEQAGIAKQALARAGAQYAARASRLQSQESFGSAAVIIMLLIAFGYLYRRAALARATAEMLAAEKRHESRTDSLTQLPNRRALVHDLERALASATLQDPLLLAVYDLDGFKQYNDTFGHPAGDGLLVRLAEQVSATVAGRATAYRMGGDEFCVLARVDTPEGIILLHDVQIALSEHGEAFSITSSYGPAFVPTEALTPAAALGLADQRLYAEKAGRASASRQSTDVLLSVLSERAIGLESHLHNVSDLARRTAECLGLAEPEIKRIKLAAELHDVGKTAIPDTILNKTEPLSEEEWKLIRRHTEIGERIVRAAPALAHTADLIRSSHEWVDGTGYPDALSGAEIPLGASIISACDAFDVMISGRPYRAARTEAEAIEELRRCSGSQFNPLVVDAIARALTVPSEVSRAV